MTKKFSDYDYREISAKMEMIIEFLKNHDGEGHIMYTLECCVTKEIGEFDILDVAMDIKDKLEWFYNYDDSDDFFPF